MRIVRPPEFKLTRGGFVATKSLESTSAVGRAWRRPSARDRATARHRRRAWRAPLEETASRSWPPTNLLVGVCHRGDDACPGARRCRRARPHDADPIASWSSWRSSSLHTQASARIRTAAVATSWARRTSHRARAHCRERPPRRLRTYVASRWQPSSRAVERNTAASRQPSRAWRHRHRILTLGNLRGTREAGIIFAAPTYLYVSPCMAHRMGLLRLVIGDPIAAAHPPVPFEADATRPLAILLVLRAFASARAVPPAGGGRERRAIVQAPEWKNPTSCSRHGDDLRVLFLAISFLATTIGIVPDHSETGRCSAFWRVDRR